MNTDWNSPQGDFDTAEKQGELLMLLSRQQVTVHTWDDPDFDYMEEQDLALVVQSPSGTEDLLIELCGEFSRPSPAGFDDGRSARYHCARADGI